MVNASGSSELVFLVQLSYIQDKSITLKRRQETIRVRILNEYRVVYLPEHPAAMTNDNWKDFVYEHIVIVEKMLGRRLKHNEDCHHLDGDHSNNRTENLLTLSHSQHQRLHIWLRKGAPGHESFRMQGMNSRKPKEENNHTLCQQCSTTLQQKQQHFCSNKCVSLNKRKTWPPKEQLQKDIKQISWCSLGRKYKVSDNAVRKWARVYGLIR